MATASQMIANRANAGHSTGPRSVEGKLASAANSVTTGLTASKLFVRPDEQAAFDAFEDALCAELQPLGILENELFDRIRHASWNLRRCDALESKVQQQAFEQDLDDAMESEDLSRQLDRIYRYKKTHEASRRRAVAELRVLQTERIRRRENQELMEESILVHSTPIINALSVNNAREDRSMGRAAEAHLVDIITGGTGQRK